MTTEYIETRMIPLAELQPYPGNARHGDREVLVESLEENGQYRSLIVRHTPDGEYVVLCGNNTLAALEHRGDTEARCELVECDDATALRVNLVDNASNDKATYDDAARAALLVLLDGEVSGSGYTEDEADTIIAQYEEPEIAPYAEPVVAYNDDADEREARKISNGGEGSKTMESRGIRDVFLPLPVAQADELGRLIMRLREEWGALAQGEIILRACRVARAALAEEYGPDTDQDLRAAADEPYVPEGSDA